jgi:hypothetical protein
MKLGLIARRQSMEVHDFPFGAYTPQDQRTPLARGVAAQSKCDDGVSIHLLNQQVLCLPNSRARSDLQASDSGRSRVGGDERP